MTCYDMLQHDRQCVAATATVIQTHNLACPRSTVPQSDMTDMTRTHAIIPTVFWLAARRVCVLRALRLLLDPAAWVACRIALYLRVACAVNCLF